MGQTSFPRLWRFISIKYLPFVVKMGKCAFSDKWKANERFKAWIAADPTPTQTQRNGLQHNTTDHNAMQRNTTDTTQRIATQCNTTQQNSPQNNKTGNKNRAHVLNKPVEVTSSTIKNSTEKNVQKMLQL